MARSFAILHPRPGSMSYESRVRTLMARLDAPPFPNLIGNGPLGRSAGDAGTGTDAH
jgi:hypothetical protein